MENKSKVLDISSTKKISFQRKTCKTLSKKCRKFTTENDKFSVTFLPPASKIFWCFRSFLPVALLTLLPVAASFVDHRTAKEIEGERILWSRGSRHAGPQSSQINPTLPPVFDPTTPTNVTVTASKTALLSCVVHNLGNNSVSWIRHKDLHILSVGKATYTNDDRFRVVPRESFGDWTLRILYASERDSGQYDCQVSSRPPIGRTVHLTVVEPKARILRGPEMHVGAGSLINLTCLVQYSPEPPEYLYWYHKERMVREDGYRIFINNQLGTRSVSQLVVKNAQPKDSGIYTCSPAHSQEHYVTVHVVTDGYPAAMQGGSSVTSVGHKKLLWLMTAPLILALISSHKPYFYM
ncbi:UNVERIFIED_CONTAM: hypothetical protein RMT77_000072 [Armadillidium vulgare]